LQFYGILMAFIIMAGIYMNNNNNNNNEISAITI